MDEKILNEFAAEMLELLRDGSQFIGDQAPIVCREILSYNLWLGLFVASLGVVIGVFGYWAFKQLMPKYKGWEEEPPYPHLVAGACFVVSLLMCAYGIPTVFKILLAPRLYLLDYFTRLLG